jgi:hypothetical protein
MCAGSSGATKRGSSALPMPPESQGADVQKWFIALTTAAGFLIVAYFVYANRPGPCDGIFEQTAPSLSVKLDALKVGAWAIGPKKLQEVDKDAQKIAVHLKSCCISQQTGHMNPEQYQVCVNGAKDYEAKIVQITNIIKEADAAKQQGNTQLADQKVAEAKETVDASAGIAFEQLLPVAEIRTYQKLVCVKQDGKLGGHGSATRQAIHKYLVELGDKAESDDPDRITLRDGMILSRQIRDGKSACAQQ